VLALHGHGGSGEEIVRGLGLYWYGRAMAEMGYVVMAPDIGQHDLQHTNWCLMGERVWDAIRCLDYLQTRREVDGRRIAVAGLSLGGEAAMYVAALDERVKAACSSGWLTTVQNMRNGHCPCWNFPGLEEHFDFADIFACVAPRPLVCEVGNRERAPGGFPVPIARQAFEEVRAAYRVFDAETNLALTVHDAGHVFNGQDFWPRLLEVLGAAYPWAGGIGSHEAVDSAPRPRRVAGPESVAELLRRGEIARRNFCRALGVLDGWWKTRDPSTGLYPRRLDQPVWAPNDNAADMLPFLALTAYFVAPERLDEVLQIIPKERILTSRLGALPDWWALTNRAFVHPAIDTNRLVFCAAEYCKDGLLPMTEVMGRGQWTDRIFELVQAVFEHAPVASDFGPLPANDTEVNGEMLQVLSRLYFMTGDRKYLAWAIPIGDAYCFEVLQRMGGIPAHRWDFTRHRPFTDEFSLNDHGNEIIGGLSELYLAVSSGAPEKATQYREPLRGMARRLEERACNADGLWVERVRASTGEVLDGRTPDTWGYAMSAILALGRTMREPFGDRTALTALSHLTRPCYLDWHGADSYADAIEGGLVLLNRCPVRAGFIWLERILPIFLGKQREDGVVEGWYGDGNYARTALMAALYYTQGARCEPWSPRLRLGAAREANSLHLALQCEESWEGVVKFDLPRHRLHLNLPLNYPRLNEFPEWYTVEPERNYEVKVGRASSPDQTGAQLASGLAVKLSRGEAVRITLTRR
jgi:hypothetical protein